MGAFVGGVAGITVGSVLVLGVLVGVAGVAGAVATAGGSGASAKAAVDDEVDGDGGQTAGRESAFRSEDCWL